MIMIIIYTDDNNTYYNHIFNYIVNYLSKGLFDFPPRLEEPFPLYDIFKPQILKIID